MNLIEKEYLSKNKHIGRCKLSEIFIFEFDYNFGMLCGNPVVISSSQIS